jgi:hypothetical protein
MCLIIFIFELCNKHTSHAYRLKKCQIRFPVATAGSSTSSICLGNAVTLNSAATSITETSPTYTYSWSSSPSGFNSSSQNPSATPTGAGTYTYIVTITNNAGCSDTASVNVVVDACTGVEETAINENELNIFPNPTTGIINLNEEFTINNNFEIAVYNSYGEIIFQEKNSKILDLSGYTNGIYYLTVKTDDMNIINKKVILIK